MAAAGRRPGQHSQDQRARRDASRHTGFKADAYRVLQDQLSRARAVEAVANRAVRARAVQAGTARLVHAALAAGWRVVDVADALATS